MNTKISSRNYNSASKKDQSLVYVFIHTNFIVCSFTQFIAI